MIVVIDNYDSFTYNLVDYIGKLTSSPINVYRNDKISIQEIDKLSPSHIVISPGPKTPFEAGISIDVIKHFSGKTPLLGVCLGHQSIGVAFGSSIIRAKKLMHGKTSMISYTDHPLFDNVENPFQATRYHSLVIDPNTITNELTVLARADDDKEIMAVAHKEHPTFGLQFHPESICTQSGLQLIRNFLSMT